ncbi:transcription antitermination factor NusB [Sandaracinobacteroides saxicola]|uniref:Transcription antitermination protein NusB n=1 Tax=Sandaracinobacteroides saxicola TaxID=2759707 RepID=A0A7G5IKG1_9SPHN|nr:transcription antitermination factor NusB [Sandaracinobacteroides saxicola]QMW23853.1 transcription antitermination factor NusB [Sandaracinobacteroides saxicola]
MRTPRKKQAALADARARRSAARLAAVQAIYQHWTAATPVARLLHEFHDHRLGAEIEDEQYLAADAAFFDDVVTGVLLRQDELDMAIAERLAEGWTLGRLDRLMHAILAAGAYELVARADVPRGAVVNEYVEVARAFYPASEAGFVNALLDRLGKAVRPEGVAA